MVMRLAFRSKLPLHDSDAHLQPHQTSSISFSSTASGLGSGTYPNITNSVSDSQMPNQAMRGSVTSPYAYSAPNAQAIPPKSSGDKVTGYPVVSGTTVNGSDGNGADMKRVGNTVVRPQLGKELFASCPMVCCVSGIQDAAATFPDGLPLPVVSLKFEAHCHISIAFVKVELICEYPMDWRQAPLLFFLPKTHDTTITDLLIENLVKPQVFATAIVPVEEARKAGFKHTTGGFKGPDVMDGPPVDPELFVLPLPGGEPGDRYRISFMYFHPLLFEYGNYVLRIPSEVPYLCIPQGMTVNQIVDVRVTINTGVPGDVVFHMASHPCAILHVESGSVEVAADARVPWDNHDVEVTYLVWREGIVASVNVEPPLLAPTPDNPDPRGSFCLSVAPPAPEYSIAFPRSVIFILDRSGSMTGDPITYAKAALLSGLRQLNSGDEFTICAFDHEQIWWSEGLIEVLPNTIAQCEQWIENDVGARGLTDIMSPLRRALEVLTAARGLPFIFLLTDGCVDNERDICHYVQQVLTNSTELQFERFPRVCTFGIGPYCNHYFLKLLSVLAKGLFDVAFRPVAIQVQMERMLQAAARPVLCETSLSIPGLQNCELYPFPIPDLFCGQPLLVSGKFEGHWPDTIELAGTLPNGQPWSQVVASTRAQHIPLHKVFVKTMLDLMTARAWLQNNPQHLVGQIVDMSVASGVPCAHTVTVGYETTPERLQQMVEDKKQKKPKKILKYAIGGAAGVAIIAGVAAAMTFGDLASTLANSPVMDAMGGVGDGLADLFGGMDVGCCDGCEGCGECLEVCGACATC